MYKTLSRKAFGAICLSAALLSMFSISMTSSSVVMAETPPAEDVAVELSTLTPAEVVGTTTPLEAGQLDALKVEHVQPVAFMDTTSAAQVQASIEAVGQVKNSADLSSRLNAPKPVMPQGSGDQGMGFAGDSSQVDIVTLQYGYILGALPLLQIAKGDEFQGYVAELQKLSSAHKLYAPAASAQIEAYLKAAATGKIDQVAYMGMLREATQGIANSKDPSGQRLHGYLLMGLWSGFVSMASEAGKVPANIFAIGNALEQLMTQDSSYGSSDQRLAGQLKVLNSVLKEEPISKEKVATSIKVILATKADK